MTEIKIEKKKSVWPWVLLLAVLAAGLIYLWTVKGRPVTEPVKETASLIDVRENNPVVTGFVTFIEDSKKMGLDHVYTNQALRKAAEATKAMAGEIGYETGPDLDKVTTYSEAITEDKFKTTHADSIRKGTDTLTDALQGMQQARYPQLANEVAELRDASSAIKPDVLTLDQKDAVKGFFEKYADVLKKMN